MRQFFKSNSKIFTEVDALPLNRALLFGDGIFETMCFINGQFRFHQDHQNRAVNGLQKLKINGELDLEEIGIMLRNIFGTTKMLRVRWNIYRSGIGKYSPIENTACEHLIVSDFNPSPKTKSTAYISQKVHTNTTAWSGVKTLNALHYIMANIERQEKGMADVILLDEKGFVSEAGSSNIFWVKGDQYYTPSLSTNCIAGVSRKQIIGRLKDLEKHCEIGKFKPNDLLKADQVFVSNVTGISYLLKIEDRDFAPKPEPELLSLFDL
ncbi:aminotransferase class IV [Cyclobacterium sp. 1_MG-2023]|uniref:aminotransferase class IV n=1 Tax=Cyclobacterium sp. 1_MG-2023 TaxID=3062681 RepID=UPI0026E34416|nr:aminotransferase class IV [Cyclobacterium sp. 1_MG-2023]MDO6436722.1 aminotransferase class IV [Cyclobacterium sp. 1_MG-2023]